ncbi:long-chain-alcohol oxidase FAO4A-like [Dioscorea cayenensis subsp. rotundata]|uniref:Long-chain-alcohol oxidase n=1 Tax=Dioscorea cayennensis subsp. rotundata TaxID=55577 RepID=A0AB40C9F5_DIOCR|nr:long-chain-alcohol oxidase FAO4A-like [Dioscorea cayenensis subsp. rotundata]
MAPPKVHDVSNDESGKRWSLWSGRPFGPNKLFKKEQESLAALCDALLPSMDLSNSNTKEEAVSEFYTTSASMTGTPDMIGSMLAGEFQHPAVPLLRLALLLLSTWYGTFILCGRDSLSDKFPYFQKFSKVDVSKREQILLSWSLSPFALIRMLFKAIKFITMRLFFSQVDEKGKNVTWQAMDYIGPDPDLQGKKNQEEEKCKGPLHSILVHINTKPHQAILDQLQQTGFPAPTLSSSNLLTIHCDAVIIGSGSGGSVAASVLAKSGHKVIVVEKGHYYQTTDLSLLEGPTASVMYEGGGVIATDNIGVVMLAGSTIGGGSTINWSASIRTPDYVIKNWCHDHGLELFSSSAYQRALDSVCERMSVQPHVLKEGFNNAVLRKGCAQLGIPVTNVPCNAPSDHYCGWCHLGCKDAKKKSAQETWLVDLVESGNGLIIPGCSVLKVLHKIKNGCNRSEATGVVVQLEQYDQQQAFVIESKITIVACGALNTPPLLKRSGLKNKHIGKNLHVHPCAMAWGYFPEEQQGWPEKTMRSYEGAIITAMASVVSKQDGYGVILQTPALHPGMFSVLMPWISAQDFRERMRRFSRTAHVFALARDKGAGMTDYPKSLTYKLADSDEENLREGLVMALKILAAAGAEEIGTHHCDGERFRVKGSEKNKFDEYLVRVRKMKRRNVWTPISTAHQMGSCRMGVDQKTSAVSPDGETWEVEGLFVADTSVFPTALGVNPMVTVMAIAHCIANSALRFLERKI